jgi:hypothetical protein
MGIVFALLLDRLSLLLDRLSLLHVVLALFLAHHLG